MAVAQDSTGSVTTATTPAPPEPLILFSSFRAYFDGYRTDGRTGEGIITMRVPLDGKDEAHRISNIPGAVGRLDFHVRERDA